MLNYKEKHLFHIIALSCVMFLVLFLLIDTTSSLKGIFTKANDVEYTIVLNEDNAVSHSGTISQRTAQKRNNVRFLYSNVGSYSNGHTKLNAGGYLRNVDQITSITSITSTFNTNGSLLFRASYDGNNWSDKNSLESGQNFALPSNPYYVEFSTDGSNFVEIESIEFTFTCRENPQAVSGFPQIWGAITESTVDLNNADISSMPYGLKLSYYTDIFSRGFAWATEKSITDSELYIIESNLGSGADFSSASLINGEFDNSRNDVTIHKAYVTGLSPSTTYSYKVGSNYGWKYGVFKTDSTNPTSLTSIQISDAQTKNYNQLYVWENSFAQAIETAGRRLDMVLYNGDQMQFANGGAYSGKEYSGAVETIGKYLESTPYMTTSGNHEAAVKKFFYVLNNTINFAGTSETGGYYSFNYGKVHFVVLNTNDTPGLGTLSGNTDNDETSVITKNSTTFTVHNKLYEQASWLVNDLDDARQNSDWIIVMMHGVVHSTGDHSADLQTRRLTYSLAPIFSHYHVDTKTLPYRWDTIGYTTSYNDSSIINFNPGTIILDGRVFDSNSNGTYYVTTGAAGHRVGAEEANSGIYADVYDSTGLPLLSNLTYLNNYYKTEVGRITQNNSYTPYTYNGATSDQIFNVGDYATGNVNAQMFGILNIDGSTLTYDFYTVEGNNVRLFDALNVYKTL